MWERAGCVASNTGACAHGVGSYDQPKKGSTEITKSYEDLLSRDEALDKLIKNVAVSLDNLACTEGNSEKAALARLEESIEEIKRSLEKVRGLTCETEEERLLQPAMIERYEGILVAMEQAVRTILERGPPASSSHTFRNRASNSFLALTS